MKKTADRKKLVRVIMTQLVTFIMASVFLLDIYTYIMCNKYEKRYAFTKEDFSLSAGDDRIHFLNTANSDCILIESNGHFALVDSGEGNKNPRKKTAYHGFGEDVIGYLKKAAAGKDGKVRLDFILGTHCHYDHYGNFEEIITSDDIIIEKAYFKKYDVSGSTELESEGWGNAETYKKIIAALEKKNIPLIQDLPDEEFMFGDFTAKFINTVTPEELKGRGENSASVGVKLKKGERTAFLAADITAASGLEVWYGDSIGQSDLLKIGHHGYFGSSSRSFLKKIKPQVAIVTNYLGKIYPNVKWNLTVTAKVPIYSCVNKNGIVATFTDNNRIVLSEHAMDTVNSFAAAQN